MRFNNFMAVAQENAANQTISNRWGLGANDNSLANAFYNASYISEPIFSLHEKTLCIGEGCWNGNGARQLHPNQKRVAGLWAARIEGISNIGYNAEEILSNIRGIEKLSAVFDTTTRYMIFPSAVWNVLAYNW